MNGMPKTHCCPECFGDHGLRDSIFPSLDAEQGQCPFCGSNNVLLIEPGRLGPYFELLASVYDPDPNGKSLIEWMKQDWGIFEHPAMDVAHAKELVAEILNDGEVVRRAVSPSPNFDSQGLVHWETLREEVMFRNRWFLEESIDTDRLRQLLELLIPRSLPVQWYRARLQAGAPYPIAEMGAPPRHLARHGRANPAGIPYLYLGSSPETAVAELRPHTGETACVAKFDVPQINAVDLRSPRRAVSPFILSDADAIGQLRADLPFLERLGDELTRPVVPGGAAIDYIPSQYLCEFIKKCSFDGVVYRSSVSDGMNLALFRPERATGKEVHVVVVEKVSVSIADAPET